MNKEVFEAFNCGRSGWALSVCKVYAGVMLKETSTNIGKKKELFARNGREFFFCKKGLEV